MSTFIYKKLTLTIFLTLFYLNDSLNELIDDNSMHTMPFWPWKQQEYPNPYNDWKLCNNISQLFTICDPDRLLNNQQIINLSQLLLSIENMTKCHTNCFDQQNDCHNSGKSGLIIGIALAKQTFYDKSSYDNKFADGIRNKWQLSKCDNDLIFFISGEKHKMSVSVGTRSRNIFDFSFDQITEEVENIFDKTSHDNYYEFLTNASKQYAHNYQNRFQLLLSSKEKKPHEKNNRNLGSNIWLPWNSKQPFSILLGILYCFILTSLLMIACYYCCGKKFNNNNNRINNSSVSSEQTTKYSEIKQNITETEESAEIKL